MIKRKLLTAAVVCVLAFSVVASDVIVEALLPNGAVVKINGNRHTLRAGQSIGDVRLISADAKAAVIEISGQRQTVGISQRITGNFQVPEKREVTIPKDALKQYRTVATINGRRVAVIVDTGANTVALSASQASALGVDYESGIPTSVETASGKVDAWVVSLDSVDVGGIRVDKVQAAVTDSDFPSTILLGMTYLEHVDIAESNGVLSLKRDW
jgi:aspartyl protease family protein